MAMFALAMVFVAGCAGLDLTITVRIIVECYTVCIWQRISHRLGIALPQRLEDYLQQSHVANLSLYVAKQKQVIAPQLLPCFATIFLTSMLRLMRARVKLSVMVSNAQRHGLRLAYAGRLIYGKDWRYSVRQN